jgi:DNA-binding IclR family transcriptional regulator
MKRTPYPGTQAVQRAIALLKSFAQHGPELRLSELASAVHLNKTTAFRLLTALENGDMIERSPGTDAYRLGPAVVMLASHALGGSGLRAAARATLRALAEDTRETVTLEVLVGNEVLILDEVLGQHVIGAMPSLGTRWAAHATSTGKVLLAGLPEEDLEVRLAPALMRFTARTVVDKASLRRELGRARDQGFATTVEELEPGYVAVAAPVRSAGGTVVAALSVGGPRSRLTPAYVADIARKLKLAGDSVSERLGWKPEAISSRDRAMVVKPGRAGARRSS